MIIEIIVCTGIPLAIAGINTLIDKRKTAKKDAQNEEKTNKLQQWMSRPIIDDIAFQKLTAIITTYDTANAVTNAEYPNALIDNVISSGYRFSCVQIVKLNEIMNTWSYWDGKQDLKRVRNDLHERTHHVITCAAEAKEAVLDILGE
jgi:hypothetical protein